MGAEPSITSIPFEELPPRLRELLAPRYQRLGYLGAFFQAGAHEPDTLATFIAFTETAKSKVRPDLVELISLTMAQLAGNRYELHQHERLSLRLGLGAEWVSTVEALDPSSLDDADHRLVQRFLLDADQGGGTAVSFAPLVARFGPGAAMAMLFLAGRYVAHAYIARALELEPPVPSIFEDGFDPSSADVH